MRPPRCFELFYILSTALLVVPIARVARAGRFNDYAWAARILLLRQFWIRHGFSKRALRRADLRRLGAASWLRCLSGRWTLVACSRGGLVLRAL